MDTTQLVLNPTKTNTKEIKFFILLYFLLLYFCLNDIFYIDIINRIVLVVVCVIHTFARCEEMQGPFV